MAADEPPAQQEQGDVQQDNHRADGGPGQSGMDDLSHAGDAAEADEVGGIAPVEAQRVDRAGQGEPEIGGESLVYTLLHGLPRF